MPHYSDHPGARDGAVYEWQTEATIDTGFGELDKVPVTIGADCLDDAPRILTMTIGKLVFNADMIERMLEPAEYRRVLGHLQDGWTYSGGMRRAMGAFAAE